MALGVLAAWTTVALLATLALGLPRAGWVLGGSTLLALAAMLLGVERVDALDVAWLCLAVPAACWILIPATAKQNATNQAIS
jgi:hypothetical protein